VGKVKVYQENLRRKKKQTGEEGRKSDGAAIRHQRNYKVLSIQLQEKRKAERPYLLPARRRNRGSLPFRLRRGTQTGNQPACLGFIRLREVILDGEDKKKIKPAILLQGE